MTNSPWIPPSHRMPDGGMDLWPYVVLEMSRTLVNGHHFGGTQWTSSTYS